MTVTRTAWVFALLVAVILADPGLVLPVMVAMAIGWDDLP